MNFNNKILELLPGTYIIPGTTNVGIVTDKNPDSSVTDVYVIDTGNTEVDGEYILDVLNEYFSFHDISYKIKAIINTHAHADHSGGNSIIKEKTDCEIWISNFESSTLYNPHLHTSVLWGANPPKEILTVYYKPDPTYPTKIVSENDSFTLSDGRTITFMSLPGHSYESMGIIITYKNDEKIIFAGDAIFPRDEIGNHSIPLILDHIDFVKSLEKIASLHNLTWCIPGHGSIISKNLSETLEEDKIAIITIEKCIFKILENNKLTTDILIKQIADTFNMNMNVRQYALIGFTLRCFLTTLRNAGILKIAVEDNLLYWTIKAIPENYQ